jgi:hypothetical protein
LRILEQRRERWVDVGVVVDVGLVARVARLADHVRVCRGNESINLSIKNPKLAIFQYSGILFLDEVFRFAAQNTLALFFISG